MKILLLFLTLGICTCNAQVNPAKKQPASTTQNKPDFSVALKFMNDYIRYCNLKTHKPSMTAWIRLNSLLTPTFKRKYQAMVDEALKENPDFGLEADPIVDAQDYPEKGFTLDKTDPIQGYATVRGIGWTTFLVNLKIVEFNGKWLVDGAGIVNLPPNKQAKRPG